MSALIQDAVSAKSAMPHVPNRKDIWPQELKAVGRSSPQLSLSLVQWRVCGFLSLQLNSGPYKAESLVPKVSHQANGAHWAPYNQGPADEMRSRQLARVTGPHHQKAGRLSHMEAEKDTCDFLGCLWAAPFPILDVNGCMDKGSDSSRWKV